MNLTPPGATAAPSSLADLEDPEELDFDRRAPLMMRVEARPDSPPGPSARQTSTASPNSDYLLASPTLPPGTPSMRTGVPSGGVPGTASGPHWTKAAAAIGSASEMGSGLPGPSASSIVTAGGGGAGAVNPSSSPADSVGAGLRWIIVMVLAAALVVVFLATR